MADDAELLREAGQGSQQAWDALVARYGSRVWAVVRAFRLSPADAADVFQTTWLNLVTHVDRIREPERLGAWLATTARHECLGTLRRTGRQVPVGDQLDLETPAAAVTPVDSAVLASERDAELWRAMGRLPEHCQRLLRVLMADPAPTYEEVSRALDIPIGAIGPTRGRSLGRLRLQVVGITEEAPGLKGWRNT